ncbi:MAG: hypothetical protein JNM07_06240 [Phycisphaerae bacterium]|nr:hypothetical protein [Phycisphaerae bacterium]
MITQSWAIFLDGYRELNAKKLFWFVLAISLLVVLAFAGLGITRTGITVLWWEIPVQMFSRLPPDMLTPGKFYKFVFLQFGIALWLSWIATVLALVSTASIIPDFIQGGAVELTLSKPIGRARLFLTKYLSGLLFVLLQVSLFTLASFLVIGVRGGAWEPGLFWSIPIMTLFFSYLYSVCALLGLLTRSTIAALLLTLLCWTGLFAVNSLESIFLFVRANYEERVVAVERDIQRLERDLASAPADDAPPAPPPPSSIAPDGAKGGLLSTVTDALKNSLRAPPGREDMARRLEQRKGLLPLARQDLARWTHVHEISLGVKTVLPKTQDTIELLRRTLVRTADLNAFENANDGGDDAEVDFQFRPNGSGPGTDVRVDPRRIGQRVRSLQDSRSAAWVIGTSLGFEFVVLGLACWIFCRREF